MCQLQTLQHKQQTSFFAIVFNHQITFCASQFGIRRNSVDTPAVCSQDQSKSKRTCDQAIHAEYRRSVFQQTDATMAHVATTSPAGVANQLLLQEQVLGNNSSATTRSDQLSQGGEQVKK